MTEIPDVVLYATDGSALSIEATPQGFRVSLEVEGEREPLLLVLAPGELERLQREIPALIAYFDSAETVFGWKPRPFIPEGGWNASDDAETS